MPTTRAPVLFAGIGNEFRGDDAIGLLIAQRLRKERIEHVEIVVEDGEILSLIDDWCDRDYVFLCDAVHSNGVPGTFHHLNGLTQKVPEDFFRFSSHSIGIAELIQLGKKLNQIPEHITILGVEAKQFEMGQQLSRELSQAIEFIYPQILNEVNQVAMQFS